MAKRMTIVFTDRGESAVAAISSQLDVDQTKAVNAAVIHFAEQPPTSDGSATGEAEYLAQILANARLSSLQAAFQQLGWPIHLTFADVSTTKEA